MVDMHVPSFSVGVQCHNKGTLDDHLDGGYDLKIQRKLGMDSLCSLQFFRHLQTSPNYPKIVEDEDQTGVEVILDVVPSGGVVEEGLVPTAVPCTKSGEPFLGHRRNSDVRGL